MQRDLLYCRYKSQTAPIEMRHLVARIDSLTHFVSLILFTFLLSPLILHAFSVDSVRIRPSLTVHHASFWLKLARFTAFTAAFSTKRRRNV